MSSKNTDTTFKIPAPGEVHIYENTSQEIHR